MADTPENTPKDRKRIKRVTIEETTTASPDGNGSSYSQQRKQGCFPWFFCCRHDTLHGHYGVPASIHYVA